MAAQVALAGPKRRGGDVEDEARVARNGIGQGRPLAHEVVDGVDGVEEARPESLVVPGVLADGDGERAVVVQGEGLALGGLEVTLLVEDVVEGQQHLLLGEGDLTVGEQRGDVARAFAGRLASGRRGDGQSGADQQGRVEGCGVGERGQRLLRARKEGGFFEEVRGRIAADGELREDDQIGGLVWNGVLRRRARRSRG